jgi:hypothetical protein
MHVIYLGDCNRAEAEAKFEATVKETDGFDLMTLEDGGGVEVRRYYRPVLVEQRERPPALLRMHSLRDRYLARNCA